MKALFHSMVLIAVMMLYDLSLKAQPIGTAIIHDRLETIDSVISGQRMRLNTIVSACSSPKLNCPQYFGNTGVHYKTYTYTNESSNNECINVKLQANCSAQLFCAAYLGSFDPTDVCNNYLADPGMSIANGGTDSMSFEVNSGSQYTIVVSGTAAGDTCGNYILKIEQFATSWHGSISNTDSTRAERIYLDGIRYTCQTNKLLCVQPAYAGTVYNDGYLYKNTTANDICLHISLTNRDTDTMSAITSVAYLNSCSSVNVCYNIAADAGVSAGSNSSLWYSFMVPAGSNCLVVVYSQKDSAFCSDYVIKVAADFTSGQNEIIDKAATLNVFPNPVLQGENIFVTHNNPGFNLLEIFDVNAKKVFTKETRNDENPLIIPAATLTKGLYLIKISGAEKSVSGKIMVQ